MRRLLLALCLVLMPLAAPASDDPLASADPALLASARGGDAQAALDLAYSLTATWDEPNLRAALPFYQQAATGLLRVEGGQTNAGIATLMLGRVMNGLSDYQGALRQADAAGAIFRGINDTRLAAVALEDRATALQNLSRYPESIDAVLAARTIYQGMDPPDAGSVAGTYWTEGMSRESMDDFGAALNAYAVALRWHEDNDGNDSLPVGYLSTNIGWVYTRLKDYPRARKWQDRALAIMEPKLGSFTENITKLRINIGLVALEEGHEDEAIGWAMKALPYIAANRTQMLSDQRWTFEMLSRAFALKGQTDRAIFFGKMAVNAQQEIRATNTVSGAQDTAASQEEWRRLYQSLANLLIAQGRISEAQAVLNMEKEEEVFNFLRRDGGQSLTQTRAILTNAELGEEDKLAALAQAPINTEHELRAIMEKIDAGTATTEEEDQAFVLQEALQASADAFDAQVAAFLAAVPEAAQADLKTQFDAVGSYQAVLQTLNRPAAILQIAALEDTTHLFLTLPGLTLHREVAIKKADLAHLVFDALQAIEDVSPDAPARLQALDAVLFVPVAEALKESGTKVVMLNLDGFLRYVPFAALTDGTRYRVEDFAFALYTPAVPTQFATAARAPDSTAGFGVTEGHPGFSPLPGVKAELAAIFGGEGVLKGETELDGQFDERSLKRTLLKKPAILHIASHFNLMPGREDASFLLLGDGEHLALSKIRTTRALRFQGVDLLTLSACQTARGGDGSEIDGFAATAQLNGAGAVLASLWPVSDAATPRLMRDFYAGLIDGGLDKAEALRRAQVAMLKGEDMAEGAARSAVALGDAAAPQGMSHPYFWSAFVLMGNWL